MEDKKQAPIKESRKSIPWRTAKALAVCWFVLFVFMIIGLALTSVVMEFGWFSTEQASDVISLHLGMQSHDKLVSKGFPEEVSFILINGTGLFVLWAVIVLPLSLYDPKRADQFPKIVRKIIRYNRSMTKFWPFRAEIHEDLRYLYVSLLIDPFLVPVIAGFFIGVVVASLSDTGNFLRLSIVDMALILPHGIFELSALMLPGVLVGVLRPEILDDLLAGREEPVWDKTQDLLYSRSTISWIIASFGLVVLAAFIEAYVTEFVAKAFSGAY